MGKSDVFHSWSPAATMQIRCEHGKPGDSDSGSVPDQMMAISEISEISSRCLHSSDDVQKPSKSESTTRNATNEFNPANQTYSGGVYQKRFAISAQLLESPTFRKNSVTPQCQTQVRGSASYRGCFPTSLVHSCRRWTADLYRNGAAEPTQRAAVSVAFHR